MLFVGGKVAPTRETNRRSGHESTSCWKRLIVHYTGREKKNEEKKKKKKNLKGIAGSAEAATIECKKLLKDQKREGFKPAIQKDKKCKKRGVRY